MLGQLRARYDDWRLGIKASGLKEVTIPGGVYYGTIPHDGIMEVLDRMRLTVADNLLDIGCGKGRVLALASRYTNAQPIYGIEADEELYKNACDNLAGNPNIIVDLGQAQLYDYRGIRAAYAFNPFEPYILGPALDKMKGDLVDKSFRIAWVMESPEQRAVFEWHRDWLRLTDHWTNKYGHVISIYATARYQVRGVHEHAIEREAAARSHGL